MMSLPHIGPRRLMQLQERITNARSPDVGSADAERGEEWARVAWARILAGRVELEIAAEQKERITRSAVAIDVGLFWQRHVDAGIKVIVPSDSDYPELLRDDPEPPAALLAVGDLGATRRRAVAVVGTRGCTVYGRTIATEIGHELARSGVAVVSGLALGIDAAAHHGALAGAGAAPVAVIAGGFDQPTPQANRGLFQRVASDGLVLTETPLDTTIARWRFPARNRVIAALADAVIVVESGLTGGSLYTVDEALRRDRLVFAVPGSIRSPESAGTNRLIRDGAFPFTEVAEVLGSIGVDASAPDPSHRPELSEDARLLLTQVAYEPAMVDELIAGSGLTLGRSIAALDELLRHRLVARSGAVVQRLDPG